MNENQASQQDRAKAIIFLRHHLHDELNKNEYLIIKDPLTLWNNLRERYKYQKIVILPKSSLLLDAPEVALFKISSQLKLCGEKVTDVDMLEKTYTTFHASNVLLQQQYRERKFTKYSELISCLLVVEQNNELLMKNHQSRPTSSTPFPKANETSFCGNKGNHYRGRGRGRKYIYIEVNGNVLIILTKEMFISTRSGTTLRRKNIKTKVYRINLQRTMKIDKCYRCNMKRHLSRT